MEDRLRVFPSGTTHKDFTFILTVEVQQDVTCHKAFFEGFCSGQPGFFVNREETFDRTVFDIVGSKDGKLGSDTDAIVGSQRRPVGTQPIAVDDCFDRIVVEIVGGSVIFFAYHIHV